MRFCRRSWITGMVVGVVSVGTVAGCGSTPSKAGENAGNAVSSVVSQVKGGADAKADVSAGAVSVGSDGHATAQITATNPTGSEHDYTVVVTFSDQNGAQDVVAVTVPQVPAHHSATATARSTGKLSGPLTAKVTAAVRH